MDSLISIGKWIFMYCTDFMINAANLTGTSYYEVNAMVFVVIWPLLTVVLLVYYVWLRVRVWR
jgi:hypothetical protein